MLSETLKVCGLSTDPSTDCHHSLAGRCEEINKSEPVTSTGLLLHQYPVQTHGYTFLLVWVQIQVQFVITELQRCFRKFIFTNPSLNWTRMVSTTEPIPHIPIIKWQHIFHLPIFRYRYIRLLPKITEQKSVPVKSIRLPSDIVWCQISDVWANTDQ